MPEVSQCGCVGPVVYGLLVPELGNYGVTLVLW